MNDKLIEVPILARVEGEGALELSIRNHEIDALKLKIYEPPRLFEKFLEGRDYTDVLDFVARICGICPVAYQMTAAQAIEQCFQLTVSSWVRDMRRLFYCGEWLDSHSIHVHFLALPDFLGFKTAPAMAAVYPEEVKRGLRIQAFGHQLITLLGGRSVHPVGACVGGFFKAPDLTHVNALLAQTDEMIGDCEALLLWLAKLPLPDNSHDFTSVSLYHPAEYPFNEGRIVSTNGLNCSIETFDHFFKEFQVPYSNALHCTLEGKPYLVGPLARMNQCFQHLPAEILRLLEKHNIVFPSKNMYHSIIARAVEMYYCVLEAKRLLANYQKPAQSFQKPAVRQGEGYGATEAPRGLLWHHYQMNADGSVKKARIVPPTSQNQARIEEDLRISLRKFGLQQSDDALRSYSEMIIRNYDPCISCSTHFIDLRVVRLHD